MGKILTAKEIPPRSILNMQKDFNKNAKLVLENGIIFDGFSFGAIGNVIGEIVFNTGMTGYQEVMTDPSYFGQILTFTYPEIGNTGINFDDSESFNNIVKGIIVRNFSDNASNWRSKLTFNEWLLNKGVVGLYGIDTRALVKILRDNGSMNGVITSKNLSNEKCFEMLKDFPSMKGLNLAEKVSTEEEYIYKNNSIKFNSRDIDSSLNGAKLKVVAIDFGIKKSILDKLVAHGCEVIVLPSTSWNSILKIQGHPFSDGGSPSEGKATASLNRDRY